MRILDTLLESRAPLSLEELSVRTQIPKSTAFRIITNLIQGRYLTETDEGYWLGLKMLSFSTAVEEHLDVRQLALPHLVHLRNQTNETVHLAVTNADMQVVYLEKLASEQAVGVMSSRVGMTAPTYCTGLGKAMLAFKPETDVRQWVKVNDLRAYTEKTIVDEEALLEELRKTRERGYAIDNREHEASIRCIAAPIRDRHGDVIATISIAGPDHRMPPELVGSEMAQQIVKTAKQISASLGYGERTL